MSLLIISILSVFLSESMIFKFKILDMYQKKYFMYRASYILSSARFCLSNDSAWLYYSLLAVDALCEYSRLVISCDDTYCTCS